MVVAGLLSRSPVRATSMKQAGDEGWEGDRAGSRPEQQASQGTPLLPAAVSAWTRGVRAGPAFRAPAQTPAHPPSPPVAPASSQAGQVPADLRAFPGSTERPAPTSAQTPLCKYSLLCSVHLFPLTSHPYQPWLRGLEQPGYSKGESMAVHSVMESSTQQLSRDHSSGAGHQESNGERKHTHARIHTPRHWPGGNHNSVGEISLVK